MKRNGTAIDAVMIRNSSLSKAPMIIRKADISKNNIPEETNRNFRIN